MGRSCFPKCRLGRIMGWLQIVLGGLVIIVSISSFFMFYSAGCFLHNEDICHLFCGIKDVYDGFVVKALTERVGEVQNRMENLQEKPEKTVQELEKEKDAIAKTVITRLEYKKFLEVVVIRPLYSAHIALRQIRLPRRRDKKLNNEGGAFD